MAQPITRIEARPQAHGIRTSSSFLAFTAAGIPFMELIAVWLSLTPAFRHRLGHLLVLAGRARPFPGNSSRGPVLDAREVVYVVAFRACPHRIIVNDLLVADCAVISF
jgi:hypothetical protein